MYKDVILSEEIYRATKLALIELYKLDEQFYFFVLVISGEGHCPFISAWSYEALTKTMEKKGLSPDRILDIKWSYADSPYLDFGSEFFQSVKSILNSRPNLMDLGDKECDIEYDFRLNSTVEAIKRLDDEKMFEIHQDRKNIMINVEEIPPDFNNTIRARNLNPIEAISEWLNECAE